MLSTLRRNGTLLAVGIIALVITLSAPITTPVVKAHVNTYPADKHVGWCYGTSPGAYGPHASTISGSYAAVCGGLSNTASGYSASVIGGENNVASGNHSTAAGGLNNLADGPGATIGGGNGNRASSNDTVVAGGIANKAGGYRSTVGGGESNEASGSWATAGGGYDNAASGYVSTVSGGYSNEASNYYATAGGGYDNAASGHTSTIAGGRSNVAGQNYASVGGGYFNRALAPDSTVAGGDSNTAEGDNTSIGGGHHNTAAGDSGTVPGGANNAASGRRSFAAGFRAKALHAGAFVWADNNSFDFASTRGNEFSVRATGGARIVSAINSSGAPKSGVRLAPGSGSWSSLSDRNAKANFATVDSGAILERLASIPIQVWNYKSQDASIRHIGPTAQDFAAAFEVGEDSTTISTVDADGVALAAIQGLYQQNQELAQQNRELTARVTSLERTGPEARTTPLSPINPWVLLSLLIGMLNLALMGVVAVLLLRRRLSGRPA